MSEVAPSIVDTIRAKHEELAALTPAVRRDLELDLPPAASLARDWEPGSWHRLPMHPNELSAIESSLAAPLPDDLRSTVLELGNGMIGPGYGIKPLEMKAILGSTQRLRRRWSIPEPLFPDFTRNYDRLIRRCGDGALVISELRRGTVYIVVLNGDERGNIWYDDSANSGVVAPVVCDSDGHLVEIAQLDLAGGEAVMKHFTELALGGKRVGFGDWYCGWLDKVIAATRVALQ
ncbi:MAG: SMI1/KNR4 family protein [Deltaproteobacteria bacterium]|nr:SMI1/KNR4 family protein [Deltaproteobacteria bacterium]